MGIQVFGTTVLLLAVSFHFGAVLADLRDDVCGSMDQLEEVDSEDIGLSRSFSATIESAIPSLGYLWSSHMSYAHDSGWLQVSITSTDVDKKMFYDYHDQQTLLYDFKSGGRGSCSVDFDMKPANGFWLVPNKPVSMGVKPSSLEVLRLAGPSGFGNENIKVYQDKTFNGTMRALTVKKYVTCQQITDQDGKTFVAKFSYVFTDDKFSDVQEGSVPLQVSISGEYPITDDIVEEDIIFQTYNFFYYSIYPMGNETPYGIVCPNRKGPSNFPPSPSYISFGQEINYPPQTAHPVVQIKTIYDQGLRVVTEIAFDQRSDQRDPIRYDDFNAGLSYYIDPNTHFCSIKNISDRNVVNDYVKEKGKIQLRSPEQIFNADTVDYHYGGQKFSHGVLADVWLGVDKTDGVTVYEWHFESNINHTLNDFANSQSKRAEHIPVKRMMWPDTGNGYYSNYFYEVDFTIPKMFPNLHTCYPHDNQEIWLYVPGLSDKVLDRDRSYTTRRALKTIAGALQIKITRISNLRIFFDEGKGYITFFLLGVPPYSKDVEMVRADEPPLKEVVKNLKKKLDDKSIKFQVGDNKVFIESEAVMVDPKTEVPFAFENASKSKDSSGFTPGALGGLAISMALIGIATGGAGGYYFLIWSK